MSKEELDVLENATIALADILRLAQKHDPETGFYKPMDPYKAFEVAAHAHKEARDLILKIKAS